eukprot:GHVP01056114.1.p1 GENE.GHVP01056114.1~~GHVP01056114.1.p1  ORF type:complete len:1399 (+),score=246.03 GHVP01056114.1:129-4199(+)
MYVLLENLEDTPIEPVSIISDITIHLLSIMEIIIKDTCKKGHTQTIKELLSVTVKYGNYDDSIVEFLDTSASNHTIKLFLNETLIQRNVISSYRVLNTILSRIGNDAIPDIFLPISMSIKESSHDRTVCLSKIKEASELFKGGIIEKEKDKYSLFIRGLAYYCARFSCIETITDLLSLPNLCQYFVETELILYSLKTSTEIKLSQVNKPSQSILCNQVQLDILFKHIKLSKISSGLLLRSYNLFMTIIERKILEIENIGVCVAILLYKTKSMVKDIIDEYSDLDSLIERILIFIPSHDKYLNKIGNILYHLLEEIRGVHVTEKTVIVAARLLKMQIESIPIANRADVFYNICCNSFLYEFCLHTSGIIDKDKYILNQWPVAYTKCDDNEKRSLLETISNKQIYSLYLTLRTKKVEYKVDINLRNKFLEFDDNYLIQVSLENLFLNDKSSFLYDILNEKKERLKSSFLTDLLLFCFSFYKKKIHITLIDDAIENKNMETPFANSHEELINLTISILCLLREVKRYNLILSKVKTIDKRIPIYIIDKRKIQTDGKNIAMDKYLGLIHTIIRENLKDYENLTYRLLHSLNCLSIVEKLAKRIQNTEGSIDNEIIRLETLGLLFELLRITIRLYIHTGSTKEAKKYIKKGIQLSESLPITIVKKSFEIEDRRICILSGDDNNVFIDKEEFEESLSLTYYLQEESKLLDIDKWTMLKEYDVAWDLLSLLCVTNKEFEIERRKNRKLRISLLKGFLMEAVQTMRSIDPEIISKSNEEFLEFSNSHIRLRRIEEKLSEDSENNSLSLSKMGPYTKNEKNIISLSEYYAKDKGPNIEPYKIDITSPSLKGEIDITSRSLKGKADITSHSTSDKNDDPLRNDIDCVLSHTLQKGPLHYTRNISRLTREYAEFTNVSFDFSIDFIRKYTNLSMLKDPFEINRAIESSKTLTQEIEKESISYPVDWSVVIIDYDEDENIFFIEKKTNHENIGWKLEMKRNTKTLHSINNIGETIKESQNMLRKERNLNRTEWWEWRSSLDNRLSGIIEAFDNEHFSIGEVLTITIKEKYANMLKHELDNLNINISIEICSLLLSLGTVNTSLLISTIDSLFKTNKEILHQKVDLIVDKLEEERSTIKLVLILGKKLCNIPWESFPSLRKIPITRLPSYRSLGLLLPNYKVVDQTSLSYLLNPENDLNNTQEFFEDYLTQKGNNGIIGRIPTESEYFSLLDQDIFLYFGHGGGEKYIKSSTIKQRKNTSVSLLLGCSSGSLSSYGLFDPQGTCLNYLLGGSICTLGTIWDVTDKDIDRFTKKLLDFWLEENDCLATAVMKARSSCVLINLNGAAPVLYGLPVYANSIITNHYQKDPFE